MTVSKEKVYQYKDIINQLYVKEGRSINYISQLLDLSRKVLTVVIRDEWDLKSSNSKVLGSKLTKLYNQHIETIKNYCLNTDERNLTYLYEVTGLTRNQLRAFREVDKELDDIVLKFTSKESQRVIRHNLRIEKEKKQSMDLVPLDGEDWRDLLGYEGIYRVSSLGRVSSLTQIIKPTYNKKIGRYEVSLYKQGKVNTLKRYRLVALTFLDNPNNLETVNHIDGDKTNDVLSNLEWASYKENNYHKNHVLKRNKAIAYKKNGKFKYILVDGKYKFKTLVACAKFLNVSETTIQRYLSKETSTNRVLKLVY